MAPETAQSDGTLAQILLALGELKTQVAVMDNKLIDLPTIKSRVRDLELAKAKLYGAAIASGMLSGAGATIIGWALTRK